MALLKPLRKSPLLRSIGGFLQSVLPAKVIEKTVYEAVFEEGSPKTGLSETGLGSRFGQSNNGPRTRKIQKLAELAKQSNPIAAKAITLRKNFVCSEGFKLESTNETVQAWLDEHWQINWEGRVEKRCEALSTYGELAFWQPPANQYSGQFELGAVPREYIDEITSSPLNAERPEFLRLTTPLKLHLPGEKSETRDLFRLFHYDHLDRAWDGEVWYLGVNTLDQCHRGQSDLAPILDWLEMFDQLTYGEAERVKFLRSMLFQLKIQGANDTEILKQQKKMNANPPKPGGWLVSNETWQIEFLEGGNQIAPVLEFIRYIFGLCAGYMDMPEHYYYSAGDVNRASGEQMKAPVFAGVRTRKGDYSRFMARIAQHGVDQMVARSEEWARIAAQDPRAIEVTVASRDPERDSFEAIGLSLKHLSESLVVAEAQGWMSAQQCGEQFRDAAASLGLGEIADPNEELTLGDAQEKAEQARQILRPQLEQSYPLSPNGKREWKTNGRATIPA